MSTRTVDLPPRFYDDHVGRGFDAGIEVSRNSKLVRVHLNDKAFIDLLDDARFYVDMGVSEFGFEMLGLLKSASATVARLEAVSE